MAVPRNRHSNARKNTRRAHDALKPTQSNKCKQCQALVPGHTVCSSCGFYRGQQFFVRKGTKGRLARKVGGSDGLLPSVSVQES